MITRDVRGVFEAWLGDRYVRGWAATVQEMGALLARYGVQEGALAKPSVSQAVAAEDLDHWRAGRLGNDRQEWERLVRSAADRPERGLLRDALAALRTRIPQPGERAAAMFRVRDPEPGEQLVAWLDEKTERVQIAAPQVDHVAAFESSRGVPWSRDGSSARAYCLEWDSATILTTPDPRWGEFDRAEPARRSLAGFRVTLHAAGPPRIWKRG
ncbi:hypothetical protein [Nocardia abscessus]|uniref:hypothetical protein n=1 Tax=Nocardia abscessus TaxID=120957 RepID=UPI002458BD52|nr:hypothetical protein [Nocardia abscessus]